MKLILVAFLICSVINYSIALDCYLCIGAADNDCAKGDKTDMMINHCMEFSDSNSFCVAYEATASEQMSEGFMRTCGYLDKNETMTPCEFLKANNISKDNCMDCSSDLCNL